MALQKTISLSSGVSAAYWRVAYINVNYEHRTAEIAVFGYLDSVARSDGKAPADRRMFHFSDQADEAFPFDAADFSNENLQQRAYTALKANAIFAGATDI